MLEGFSLLNIELYILLFFTYSFAGWFMESVGGILNVKKFVNRGFLIGPYCPVYGCGVVLITFLLRKYSNDIPALFVLSTLICGTLEYATSYFMEKFFNARWWDYHNRKFNINGRICLETLVPFGIAGSLILCILNPFFISIYIKIPAIILHIITIVLSVLFLIDFIISFRIILNFKGEIFKSKDNTEEISIMVKDKTEDMIMKAESDAIVFTRKLKVKKLLFERKVKYNRIRFSNNNIKSLRELKENIDKRKFEFNKKIVESKYKVNNQIRIKQKEIEEKQKEKKINMENTIRKRKENFEKFQKNPKEYIDNRINNLKNNSEEFNKQIREKFRNKSILNNRLMNAFPNLEIKVKENKKK